MAATAPTLPTDRPARRTTRRRKLLTGAVALSLPLTGYVTLWPGGASASSVAVSGTFDRSFAQPLTCQGLLCVASDFQGSLAGHGEQTLTTLTPTVPLGILYYEGRFDLNTADGRLTCLENGVGNSKTASSGEFAALCEVTGGTGKWAGAKGYLQLTGVSAGGLGGILPGVLPGSGTAGPGEYHGNIVTTSTS